MTAHLVSFSRSSYSHSHSLSHSLSLVLVVMMISKDLKTKIYSHADAQILPQLPSLPFRQLKYALYLYLLSTFCCFLLSDMKAVIPSSARAYTIAATGMPSTVVASGLLHGLGAV